MRYIVASLDTILIDADNGWEINDQHQIGMVDISEEALDDDQTVFNILNELGYTDAITTDDYEIDGDNTCLTIINWETGRPTLQLIREH